MKCPGEGAMNPYAWRFYLLVEKTQEKEDDDSQK